MQLMPRTVNKTIYIHYCQRQPFPLQNPLLPNTCKQNPPSFQASLSKIAHSSFWTASMSKVMWDLLSTDRISLHTTCLKAKTHTHKFVSSSTRPASSLLPTLGSIKSSNEVTEAPLPWSLSHCWLLSCLQVYEQRFPFLVLAPQTS